MNNISILDLMKMMNNPQEIISNPQVQQIVNHYGDAKTAFYAICKERNVDPNYILQLASKIK